MNIKDEIMAKHISTIVILSSIIALTQFACSKRADGDGASQSGTGSLSSAQRKEIAELFREWDHSNTPGAAVVITDGGKVAYELYVGMANLEHGIPISSTTLFELASTTKQFTAMAVLLLEQAGRLRLDDDIRQYLPELQEYAKPVTIRHLLHQTSGLWDYWQLNAYTGATGRDYVDFDRILTLMQGQKELTFDPGTEWSYCNTNYTFLAEIVARVTGEAFADWTSKHMFQPLGMHSTCFPSSAFQTLPHRATGYFTEGDEFLVGRERNVDVCGQAHLFSTIKDLVKWFDNFRTMKVGGPEVMHQMLQKGTLDSGDEIFYGMGLGVSDYRGVKTIGHSGSTGGYKTMLLYCPEIEVGVALLGNVRSINPERVTHQVLDIYLGDRLESRPSGGDQQAEERAFIDLDPSTSTHLFGGYRVVETDMTIAFFRRKDRHYGALKGLAMDRFYPLSATEFANGNRNCTFRFDLDADGNAHRSVLDLKGEEMQAERIAVDITTEQLERDYTGRYYSEALDILYRLHVHEGVLTLSRPRRADEKLQLVAEDGFVAIPGFITFTRNSNGVVQGFSLGDETFGYKNIAFVKLQNL
jgi:CubicO group peptidase (beta-lactamase class C family)